MFYKNSLLKCSWRAYYAPFAVLRYIYRSNAPFYTPVWIRPSSDGMYYGMVMSVRPSVRPVSVRPVSVRPFPHFSPTCFDILSWNFAHDFVLMYYRSSLSVITLRQFLKELCLFWNLEYRKYTVFAVFSCMLWHIELKFCTWLCFNILQSKFECCHFASIFEGVMLLCGLSIQEIVFHTFLLHALTYWAEILHMTLF